MTENYNIVLLWKMFFSKCVYTVASPGKSQSINSITLKLQIELRQWSHICKKYCQVISF